MSEQRTPDKRDCPYCNGVGSVGSPGAACPTCGGTGQKPQWLRDLRDDPYLDGIMKRVTERSEQSQGSVSSNSMLRARAVIGETELHDWEERCLMERAPACKRVYLADEADREIERLTRVAAEVELMAVTMDAREQEIERLRAAAEAVLAQYMPAFPDSRAVDDCLVQLAAALSGASPSAPETSERLNDAQCDDVIEFLADYEWSGLTRENVRTWDSAIAAARSSVQKEFAGTGGEPGLATQATVTESIQADRCLATGVPRQIDASSRDVVDELEEDRRIFGMAYWLETASGKVRLNPEELRMRMSDGRFRVVADMDTVAQQQAVFDFVVSLRRDAYNAQKREPFIPIGPDGHPGAPEKASDEPG